MSILKPEPQSLNYCDLAVSIEIGKCESSNFVFSPTLLRAILYSLNFHKHFTSLSISTKKKKAVGILIGLH